MLKQNVGPLDRITRIILGLVLLSVKTFFRFGGIVGGIMLAISLLEIVEGTVGYCIAYGWFNWSTRRQGNN